MKHAICITAHKNWKQLLDLIKVLSVPSIDIYLHVDLKSRKSFDNYVLEHPIQLNGGGIFLIESQQCKWGDLSQTKVELKLFEAVLSSKTSYSYVHLISGQDLPLKSVEQIIKECNESGFEYLSFVKEGDFKNRLSRRLRYYHVLVSKCRNNTLFSYIRKMLVAFQMVVGFDRLRKSGVKFQVGANWCSLSYDSIDYIVNEFPKFRHLFEYTTSSDECYKQMILQNRSGIKFCPEGNKRYVVFEHLAPSPHTLTSDDYDNIMSSNCFFARKFDDEVDKEVRMKIMKQSQLE